MLWRAPIPSGRRSGLGLHSARDETAQFAGIGPGPLLQLGGAEGGLLPLLGSEHILGFKLEAMAAAEGQQFLKLQRLAQPFGQGPIGPGEGQKGIERREGQRFLGEGICRPLS